MQPPQARTLVYEGQSNRYLLGGVWYFRQDDSFAGDDEHWYSQRDLSGWSAIRTPHNWNATDTTLNRSSVGWYRKEFTLPKSPKGKDHFWKVRFEGANYRSKVWLNGEAIGGFTGYFPFEADLGKALRKGRNTLVVKVSTLRSRTDLTHWRPAAFNGFGTGGWWNFGGLLREVYLRRIDTVDVESVRALPHVRKVGGPATVDVYAAVRNPTKADKQVTVAVAVGGERVQTLPREVVAGTARTFHTTVTRDHPRLWQPGRPYLYPTSVAAGVDGVRRASYRLRLGVKKLEVTKGGIIELNGHPVQLRGASIHEDDLNTGAVIGTATRVRMISRLRDLHASLTRSHYPLDPRFLEAFDRAGILYWLDAPVYQLPNTYFNQSGVRYAARRAVKLTVLNNVNHASVMTWSLANEPAGNRSELGVIGDGLARYIKDASADVRTLDDTRLVALDRQSRVGEPLSHPAFRYLDALGVNEYFGWYPSYQATLQRDPTTSAELSPYLDQLHRANPKLGLLVTEFGAEAKGPGGVEQRGSYAYQQRYVLDHLKIQGSKRYINGSLIWALRDFRVEPTWSGGAPAGWTTPPWNNKSLIEENGTLKPVYYDVRSRWRHVKPLR
ncbi:MAG TPA: glycoside hydrolase family 2 TIM barrel-domain containing protein [Thermoleophilaceae bacterium]